MADLLARHRGFRVHIVAWTLVASSVGCTAASESPTAWRIQAASDAVEVFTFPKRVYPALNVATSERDLVDLAVDGARLYAMVSNPPGEMNGFQIWSGPLDGPLTVESSPIPIGPANLNSTGHGTSSRVFPYLDRLYWKSDDRGDVVVASAGSDAEDPYLEVVRFKPRPIEDDLNDDDPPSALYAPAYVGGMVPAFGHVYLSTSDNQNQIALWQFPTRPGSEKAELLGNTSDFLGEDCAPRAWYHIAHAVHGAELFVLAQCGETARLYARPVRARSTFRRLAALEAVPSIDRIHVDATHVYLVAGAGNPRQIFRIARAAAEATVQTTWTEFAQLTEEVSYSGGSLVWTDSFVCWYAYNRTVSPVVNDIRCVSKSYEGETPNLGQVVYTPPPAPAYATLNERAMVAVGDTLLWPRAVRTISDVVTLSIVKMSLSARPGDCE